MSNALDLALEALERLCMPFDDECYAAIAALKEAIKQQGEPVAEVVSYHQAGLYDKLPIGTLLYTSAPTIPDVDATIRQAKREALLDASDQMRLMKHGDSLSPHLWLRSMADELK